MGYLYLLRLLCLQKVVYVYKVKLGQRIKDAFFLKKKKLCKQRCCLEMLAYMEMDLAVPFFTSFWFL